MSDAKFLPQGYPLHVALSPDWSWNDDIETNAGRQNIRSHARLTDDRLNDGIRVAPVVAWRIDPLNESVTPLSPDPDWVDSASWPRLGTGIAWTVHTDPSAARVELLECLRVHRDCARKLCVELDSGETADQG